MVRPLIGTGVKPNHLTALRLITGMGACALIAAGAPSWRGWAAILWLVSAFLDRADGELARIGDMMSEQGHRYDYLADMAVNTLVFAAAGIGGRHGWLGPWAIGLGLLTSASMLICWITGEAYQKLKGPGSRVYEGRWGFDLDDGLYLLAPLIWLGVMDLVTAGAAAIVSVMAIVIVIRLGRLKASLARDRAAQTP